MKRLIPFASIAFLFLATGCLKEDIPTTVATEAMLAESADALQGMLNGIPAQMVTPYFSYNGTRNSNDFDFSYPSEMIIMDTAAGELVLTGRDNYDWFMYWIRNNSSMGETSGPAGKTWTAYYKYIRTCNNLVSIIGYDPDKESSQEVLGHVLAYRAFFYLNLVRLYAYVPATDPNVKTTYAPQADIAGLSVPIVVENMDIDQTRKNPRARVDDVYALIFSDLD